MCLDMGVLEPVKSVEKVKVVVAGWEGGEKGAAGEKMRRRGDMAVDPEK